MPRYAFEAFGNKKRFSVPYNDFSVIEEKMDAMSLANEWLWTLRGYSNGGHHGKWVEFSGGYLWVPD